LFEVSDTGAILSIFPPNFLIALPRGEVVWCWRITICVGRYCWI